VSTPTPLASKLSLLLAATALASAWIALHPELLSVAKIWDSTLSTVLLLLLVVCALVLTGARTPVRWPLVPVSACVFSAAIFCRPNLLLLTPLLLLSVWRSSEGTVARTIRASFFLAVTVAGGVALLGVAAHGTPFFPRNGPYNFYAGHNPDAADALRRYLNAEPSIFTSMARSHPGLTELALHDGTYDRDFTLQAISFARQQPGVEAKLAVLKLVTLFRPARSSLCIGAL
jgi:hypothetical protein